MVGPSSSHTAGAVRLGLMARNIYKNEFKKVKFVLYNSFAKTGFGHGTDKGLLAGVLGYSVDEICIKNIFDIVENIEYSYEYKEDISRHPNSVDITFDDKMTVSGDSVGAGEIQITNINNFSVKLNGKYNTLLLVYEDMPGVIAAVTKLIQEDNVNIASLHCDRSGKGKDASMCICIDGELSKHCTQEVSNLKDMYVVRYIEKLEN